MDGKGRYIGNVFIERLWRSLKYECVYLHAWETGLQAKAGIARWITFYNHQRPHTAQGLSRSAALAPLASVRRCFHSSSLFEAPPG